MEASLRDLQLALFDMLKDIDSICREQNIQYSLACGTALGAVRHQGFIPWDDDVDIMFLRSEYDKFLEIAPKFLKEKGYTLQKEFSSEWPMQYSKVRKDNTTYIEAFEPRLKNLHQGIFIDLFPIDNLSDNKILARIQWDFYHLLVAKGMAKRGYQTNSRIKHLLMACSPLFPEKMLRAFVMQKGKTNTQRVHCFLGGAVVKEHNIFPRSFFDSYITISFEEYRFPIVKDYDGYLKVCFNDYMKLPPEEKRAARRHALKVDLERPYTEYLSIIDRFEDK